MTNTLDRVTNASHTNLQNACRAAAVDILTVLEKDGADTFMTVDECAALIYKNIHGRTSL